MITEGDAKNIEKAIEAVKLAQSMEMKGRKDIVLTNGTSISIYHLGIANSTIRIDIKY